MKLDFRNNRDFWAGAMFIAGGAVAMIAARSYLFGTKLRMGPGYFPSLLGGDPRCFWHLRHGQGTAQRRKDQG
ncbi:MAG: hypothetical protein KKC25_02350 [Proteobacteria bacterium]|nr:hypothetical protein [Pseudomonadota bacterium]